MQQDGQQTRLDPQRVIARLQQQLAEAQLQAAQFGALADQLAEENAELRRGNTDNTRRAGVDEAFTVSGSTGE